MQNPSELSDVVERVQSVLFAEKRYLVAGQTHEVVGLVKEKMAALETFHALFSKLSPDQVQSDLRQRVEDVIALASENASHFEAMRNGLRSVISRLGSLTEESYVGAYRLDGGKTAFSKASGGYLKKA